MKLILTSSGHFVTDQMPKYLDKDIRDYKIAYITTAGGGVEDKEYMNIRRKRMDELDFDYEEIDIADKTEDDVRKMLSGKNIVYVEGGNTYYLLKQARLSGFNKVIKELVENGVVYVGSSAGSYLACPSIEMCEWVSKMGYDKYGIEDYTALNLVPFMMKVHVDKHSEEDMKRLQEIIKKSEHEVKLLNDNQALIVEEGKVQLVGDEKLKQELIKLCDSQPESKTVFDFKKRIEKGSFTIQENPESHFCVYFAAYDSEAKKVFIGHHKKSGFWLFNGGHIDKGEEVKETLEREIGEEWGFEAKDFDIKEPELLTITEIYNPTKQTCKRHYDIWFFIDVRQDEFKPDKSKVLEEFHQADWKSYEEAKGLIKEKNTLVGVEFVVNKYFK